MNEAENARLVGMIVDAVEVDADKEKLTLRFVGGVRATYDTYGDCCSSTWIEHITVPPVAGQIVTGVFDEGQVDVIEDDPTHDCLRFYKTIIGTTGGEIIVEYRNSSNGYYGGSLEGPEISW